MCVESINFTSTGAVAEGWSAPRGRWWAAGLLLLVGCRGEMYDQPKENPYDASVFFKDGKSARPLVVGTIARGELRADRHLFVGKTQDLKPVDTFPFPIDGPILERGRERYMIFCSPCHGAVGDGKGMIVQRGFSPPPSFHTDRLREEPVGHYFHVITNGFGAMYPYASRIRPDDRWAIIAYVRALQLSRNARLDDLPPDVRRPFQERAQ